MRPCVSDAADSTFRNVSLPSRGPGRMAIFLVVLTGLATTLALGLVAAHAWYGEIQRRVETVHPAVLEWSAESVNRHFAEARSEIANVAAAASPALRSGSLDSRLPAIAGEARAFSGVFVVDGHGQLLAAAGEGRRLESLLRVLQTERALDVGIAEAMAAAELRRQVAAFEEAGVRVLQVEGENLLLASSRLSGRASSAHGLIRPDDLAAALKSELLGVGSIRLADASGTVFAQTGETSRTTLSAEALHASPRPRLNASFEAGETWTVRSASPVGSLGLTLVVEQPVLLAFQPMLVAAVQMAAAAGIVLAALVLAASLFATRLTRQLRALVDGLRGLAKADYSTRLSTDGVHGQIEFVYRGFNAMATRVEAGRRKTDARLDAMSKQNVGFQKQHEMLAKLSITDGLTQLHNHRHFQDQLGREIKRLARTNEGLSILIIDIDDFKRLNDTYGHAAGDEFLKQLAGILKESVRETDLLARYGGEEFVVVAIGTPLDGAHLLAEKLRTRIAETSFIVDESKRPRGVTVSIGVADFLHSRTELFAAADAALYRAKAAGKNCVVVADRAERESSAG